MTLGNASRERVLDLYKKAVEGFIHDDPLLFK
jgi:hypothetical protein